MCAGEERDQDHAPDAVQSLSQGQFVFQLSTIKYSISSSFVLKTTRFFVFSTNLNSVFLEQ